MTLSTMPSELLGSSARGQTAPEILPGCRQRRLTITVLRLKSVGDLSESALHKFHPLRGEHDRPVHGGGTHAFRLRVLDPADMCSGHHLRLRIW